jgi:hypothetical protein
LFQGTARKTTSAEAASAAVPALTPLPISFTTASNDPGPRLLLMMISYPALATCLAKALPILPAPIIPIVVIIPDFITCELD